jgi:hypothetical protein
MGFVLILVRLLRRGAVPAQRERDREGRPGKGKVDQQGAKAPGHIPAINAVSMTHLCQKFNPDIIGLARLARKLMTAASHCSCLR